MDVPEASDACKQAFANLLTHLHAKAAGTNGGVWSGSVSWVIDASSTTSGASFVSTPLPLLRPHLPGTLRKPCQGRAETDVDCGATCRRCADGRGCTKDADCQSGFCSGNVCAGAGGTGGAVGGGGRGGGGGTGGAGSAGSREAREQWAAGARQAVAAAGGEGHRRLRGHNGKHWINRRRWGERHDRRRRKRRRRWQHRDGGSLRWRGGNEHEWRARRIACWRRRGRRRQSRGLCLWRGPAKRFVRHPSCLCYSAPLWRGHASAGAQQRPAETSRCRPDAGHESRERRGRHPHTGFRSWRPCASSPCSSPSRPGSPAKTAAQSKPDKPTAYEPSEPCAPLPRFDRRLWTALGSSRYANSVRGSARFHGQPARVGDHRRNVGRRPFLAIRQRRSTRTSPFSSTLTAQQGGRRRSARESPHLVACTSGESEEACARRFRRAL